MRSGISSDSSTREKLIRVRLPICTSWTINAITPNALICQLEAALPGCPDFSPRGMTMAKTCPAGQKISVCVLHIWRIRCRIRMRWFMQCRFQLDRGRKSTLMQFTMLSTLSSFVNKVFVNSLVLGGENYFFML